MVEIKRILCPVDFSPISQHAFDRAVAVARSHGSEIAVLHVLPVANAVPAVPYGPASCGLRRRIRRTGAFRYYCNLTLENGCRNMTGQLVILPEA